MEHRFKLGDQVHLTYGFLDQSGSGRYEVVRLIPAEVDGEPKYRIKGSDGVERAIGDARSSPPPQKALMVPVGPVREA